RAVDLIHRREGCSHARRGSEETATIQTLLGTQLVAHGEQAGLDLPLLLILRIRHELVARDVPGRNGRLVRQQLRRSQLGEFLFAQEAGHEYPPVVRWVSGGPSIRGRSLESGPE